MAYLHCHTKGCGWSQDDFWTWRYNPIRCALDRIKWLWKPRMIEFDKQVSYGRMFSWHALLLELRKLIHRTWRMRWWTWKAWKRGKVTARCPNCGQRNFDID